MKPRVFERWVTWLTVVICAALASACSAPATDEGATSDGRRGNLAVALKTTAESGATYYLEDAVVLVSTEGGTPVTALSSDQEPEAEVISVELDPGRYLVALQDGWSLSRRQDGNVVTVPGTLTSPASLLITVFVNREGRVNFAFRTEEEDVSFERSSLGVTISVEESGTCGNGVTEAGEVCDSGPNAGRPNQCDLSCQFQCDGACPLRVDPSATVAGDGSSWESPMRFVQAALDIQAALGGGEVWVRGPGPFESLSGAAGETLIELREGTALLGGFDGTETASDQRAPGARTVIAGVTVDDNATPLVTVASNSSLDGIEIVVHYGPALSIRDAENFSVSNVVVTGSLVFSDTGGAIIEVSDSQGVFEGLVLADGYAGTDGVAGIYAERSDLQVRASEFTDLLTDLYGGIVVYSSRLVVDGSRFVANSSLYNTDCQGVCAVESDVLVVDSLWLRNTGAAAGVDARNSRLAVVNSHWERNQSDFGMAYVLGTIATFLNCSMLDNRSYYHSMIYSWGGELDVSNTTFFGNYCEMIPECPEDINLVSGASGRVSNIFSDAGSGSIGGSHYSSGNCLLNDPGEPEIYGSLGYSQVFLPSGWGCADDGDDAVAIEIAERVREFAAELGVSPPIESGAWWQGLTSIYPLCSDSGPVDPGRHYEPPPLWCEAP